MSFSSNTVHSVKHRPHTFITSGEYYNKILPEHKLECQKLKVQQQELRAQQHLQIRQELQERQLKQVNKNWNGRIVFIDDNASKNSKIILATTAIIATIGFILSGWIPAATVLIGGLIVNKILSELHVMLGKHGLIENLQPICIRKCLIKIGAIHSMEKKLTRLI